MAEKDYLATRLFTDRDSAEREYQGTLARGYDPKDINVVMTEEGRKRHFGQGAPTELGNKALEGAGVGGGIGAVTGGALAAIAVAATVAVPGLGLLVAGPIASALAGAGARETRRRMGRRSVGGWVKTATDKGLVVVGHEEGQQDKEWAFALDGSTRIDADGKPRPATELREGDAVTVSYTNRDGKIIAQNVKANAR